MLEATMIDGYKRFGELEIEQLRTMWIMLTFDFCGCWNLWNGKESAGAKRILKKTNENDRFWKKIDANSNQQLQHQTATC